MHADLPLTDLRQNFLAVLKDVYAAEHQAISALPIMIDAMQNADLKMALGAHLQETVLHIIRLDRIFAWFNDSPVPPPTVGMHAVLTEGVQAVIAEEGDFALVDACQSVEQSEIAACGTLVSWATMLEASDAAHLLELRLAEEKTAEGTLTTIAGEQKATRTHAVNN